MVGNERVTAQFAYPPLLPHPPFTHPYDKVIFVNTGKQLRKKNQKQIGNSIESKWGENGFKQLEQCAHKQLVSYEGV